MAQTDPMDLTPGEDREPEWLDAAPAPLTPAQRQLRRRVLTVVGFVMVGVLITSILAQRHDREVSSPPTPTTPTATAQPTPPPRIAPTAPAPPPGSDPVVVRRSSQVVDDTSAFDVFALSAAAVYRIEAGTGRVTKTAIELGAGVDQASFLALPGGVIVRPGDSVPGVLVRDGRGAEPLRGLLRRATVALPGPDGHVWAASYDSADPVRLSDLRGRAVGPVSPSPVGWALSDQAGHLLVTDVGGTYESSPSGLRRVTTGQVTAAGAHHYVVVECDEVHRCSTSVLDRRNGSKRRLGPAQTGNTATGIVAPDGRHAVLSRWSSDGTPSLLLQDLRTGRTRGLGSPGSADSPSFVGTDGIVSWTPDSRHLFVVTGGGLAVLDAATARVTKIDLGLSGLVAVAVRPVG